MMDMSWVTGRIAVGGGIWTAENMAQVAIAEVTHIIDMQIEFDDTALALPHGITVLWNPIDDDFQPKSPEVFQRGVDFALEALDEPGTKLFVHCAAGVHRAPMMTLAILCSELEAGGCAPIDRSQTSSRRFCGCICEQRQEISAGAGKSREVGIPVLGSQFLVLSSKSKSTSHFNPKQLSAFGRLPRGAEV
jgi:hypothetical protein